MKVEFKASKIGLTLLQTSRLLKSLTIRRVNTP
jgi:hypothetical protein